AHIFKHAILQEVVYGSLLFAQRQELHRAVAEWYETAHPLDLEPFYPLLAHHWESAQAPVQALTYFERAGEQAHRSYANREAVTFFTKALAALDTEPPGSDAAARRVHRLRQVRAHRRLSEAQMALGDTAEGAAHIRSALVLLGHPEPTGVPRLLASFLGAMTRQMAHRLVPRLALREEPADRAERTEMAHLMYGIMQAYYYSGNVAGALVANFRSLNMAESAMAGGELAPEVARGFGNVGAVIRSALGLQRLSARYFERARAVAGLHLPSLAYLDQIEGMILIGAGELDRADAPLARARATFEELGDRRSLEQVVFIRAGWHWLRGEFPPVLELMDANLESARRREDLQSEVLSLAQRALGLIALDRLAPAMTDLERSRWLRGEGSLTAERIFSTGLLALARARQGDAAGAATALDEVRDLLGRVPPNHVAIEGYAGAAEAALLLLETGAVERERGLGWARAALKSLGVAAARLSPVYRSRLLTLRARLDDLTGRRRAAMAGLTQALASATADLRYDEARALAELAMRDGPGAEHAGRARTRLEQIGAAWDLKRLERALTSS
ncbi:MAG TPA: hypothetical protein VFU23_16675, partial [Gemmatimonadales bacterium]|nr:hypothetical protein [Gemmatimonadales bacterium]